MEQPSLNNTNTANKPKKNGKKMPNKPKKNGKKMPTPQELVSHYEKKGMETHDASLKVIQDLQGALFRMVTANRGRNDNDVTSAKLDAIHAHLVRIEGKVDSKPSYLQAVGVGVAGAGLWSGVGQIWSAVRRTSSDGL